MKLEPFLQILGRGRPLRPFPLCIRHQYVNPRTIVLWDKADQAAIRQHIDNAMCNILDKSTTYEVNWRYLSLPS